MWVDLPVEGLHGSDGIEVGVHRGGQERTVRQASQREAGQAGEQVPRVGDNP
jgi:hypothetical protein